MPTLNNNSKIIRATLSDDVTFLKQTGMTPLHIAVQENFPDVVQLLMFNGADKYLKDEVNLVFNMVVS